MSMLRGRRALPLAAIGALLIAVAGWLIATHRVPAPASIAGPLSVIAPAPSPPPPPPPPPWTIAQADTLLDAVDRAAAEGLRPADYDRDALAAAIAGGAGGALDAVATRSAASLAHDFAAGRLRRRHRFNWYIDYAGPDAAALGAQILAARQGDRLGTWLSGLLPTNPQYRALRDALARTPADEPDRRDRIRANLERWRWLPRDFGSGDRLYVNLPTYELAVMHGDTVEARYKAVIGATDMPTPVLSAAVRQVIVNPDWIVPESIVRKSHLRPGSSSRYVFSTRPDGTLRVRQKPGSGNALGKVKIEFPNSLAIYFHDTPARSLFGASARTFSHGCVRVQNIATLAGSLVGRPERYATAMAGDATRSFPPAQPWRAEIVYLTLVADDDGGLRDVGDPYRMDAAMAAALDGRKPPPATTAIIVPPVPRPKPAVDPVPLAVPIPTLSAPSVPDLPPEGADNVIGLR